MLQAITATQPDTHLVAAEVALYPYLREEDQKTVLFKVTDDGQNVRIRAASGELSASELFATMMELVESEFASCHLIALGGGCTEITPLAQTEEEMMALEDQLRDICCDVVYVTAQLARISI